MKQLDFSLRFALVTFLFTLFLLLSNALDINAQRPKSLEKGTDDKQLCDSTKGSMRGSEYCDNWGVYTNSSDESKRKEARDAMIELVRGQIDEYYKGHKDGRRLKMQWLQLLFDVLEIGASTTADFIKGERPKSIIAAALTGFKAGHTSFNRNFQALQLQTMINRMNADRDAAMETIYTRSLSGVNDYTWLEAKTDLRQYLYAGTFGNAMDSLVEKTGQDAKLANDKMNNAKTVSSKAQ